MNKMESNWKFIKIIAKNYLLLRGLYPDKSYSILELAKKLGASPGNISRCIIELEKTKLVHTQTEERTTGGRPKKFCSLTTRGKTVIEAIEDAQKARPDYESLETTESDWKIDELSNLFEDKNASIQLRKFALSTMLEMASGNRAMLTRNAKIRSIFKRFVSEPATLSLNTEISEILNKLLSNAISETEHNESEKSWFIKEILIPLQESLDEKKGNHATESTLPLISKAARLEIDSDFTEKTIDILLTSYFEKNETSKLAKNELIKFNSPNLQQQIIRKLKTHNRKGSNHKKEAETLLQELINNWWTPPAFLETKNQ